MKMMIRIKHELSIHEQFRDKMGYKFLQNKIKEEISESENDEESSEETKEVEVLKKEDSLQSFDMPQKFTQAYNQNQQRF